MSKLPQLKVGTGWIEVRVTGETDVVPTFKGYVPVLPVVVIKTGLAYVLYISARSLTEQLEPLRRQNAGQFSGLTFSLRKQSEDKYAGYELRT